jgi:hypothetical protein
MVKRKDSTHVAVVGIVSMVAVVGLVLLFVAVSGGGQDKTGFAGEILKTRTSAGSGGSEVYSDDSVDVKEPGSGKDRGVVKITKEKQDARGLSIAAMVQQGIPAKMALELQRFNEEAEVFGDARIVGVDLTLNGEAVTGGMAATYFLFPPQFTFPPSPSRPNGCEGNAIAVIHAQKAIGGSEAAVIFDENGDPVKENGKSKVVNMNHNGPGGREADAAMCRNYFNNDETISLCTGGNARLNVLAHMCGNGCTPKSIVKFESRVPPGMQCTWTTDTNQDGAGHDETIESWVLDEVINNPVVMQGLSLECDESVQKLALDRDLLTKCLKKFNENKNGDEHDLKASCVSKYQVTCKAVNAGD